MLLNIQFLRPQRPRFRRGSLGVNRRDVVRSDEETGPMFVSFGEVNNSNSTINKSEKK